MSTMNDPTSTPETAANSETVPESTSKKLSIFDIRKLVDAKVETPETTEKIYNALVERRAEVITNDRINLLDAVEKKIGELNSDLKKIKPDVGEKYDASNKKISENDSYSKAEAEKRGAVLQRIKKIEDQLNPILTGTGNKENWVKLAEAVK